MYGKRIKIFIAAFVLLLLVCIARLVQMQLVSDSYYRDRIAKLKLQRGLSHQLRTIRGKILDRNGAILAADEPQFELCMKYRLSCLLDGRLRPNGSNPSIEDKTDQLRRAIKKCATFKGRDPCDIKDEIMQINDWVWNRRAFQAWRTAFGDSEIIEKSRGIESISLSDAMADFEKKQPDPVKRRELINKVDIAEMYESYPLVELQTDDDIFTAQLEFADIPDVVIAAKANRVYPYSTAAAQTIGWVGPATQPRDRQLFEDDRLASYLEDEVCGREDGTEFVCEALLRGRRGEVILDIDKNLVSQTPTQFGQDVYLTIDIELQQRIENYIPDSSRNENYDAPTAAVVIDVNTGDLLALVSVPVFDLNRARYDYGDLTADANTPLVNRTINKLYPPGSVVKPLILIAGMESGRITADVVIPCPARKAPRHWPSCWLFNRFGQGHDSRWENNARNAIRGSCNIYFSRLADRIDPDVLQEWLLRFGYGRPLPVAPPDVRHSDHRRVLRQAAGIISSAIPDSSDRLPPTAPGEKRYFGIGQGNLRVTPLQVANAMAAIARGGRFKLPRLFLADPNSTAQNNNDAEIDLGISPHTLQVVHEGMRAVVSETGGTAYRIFSNSGLDQRGVTVYGKTGSTEQPDHAWFGGFAKDAYGRGIALAVVVEGGQHGSSDAAPIALDIIRFCIDARYLACPY
jgi:penicillin-binding protein 2